ncbi:SDR family NAD(P)-dependent oxidoreductase [Flammeovirga yaeyamensis]|uniref:SDR family NAD(P)-dependent oxidoreductase n=1 Tax=Flammeovirga yaeyamensis TaxID=367791 RepID=A0AAX1ND00_9BACT|nr:SDR family oxidoreductase [Flammeovirga yaeyamensis]MBB3696680.1 short-subunit dehydrogenase [Flammeovirga yaeyamensis]NMF33353.1 SDR family oxidoreductase [Flammeovirga yaeyamensis]QWG05371.1 SDR family NAD(P)-dependent oxidoreductase [Flammeovirga yaeyamensis]
MPFITFGKVDDIRNNYENEHSNNRRELWIGYCIAKHLKQNGHHVIGTSRNPSKSNDIDIQLIELDITSKESIEKLTDKLEEQNFSVDVLINNAGIAVNGCFEETTEDLARKQVETNFWGAISVTRKILPIMRKQGSGKIIFITSWGGLIGVPYQSFYSASKHALEGVAKSLRHEVKEFGIDVSTVEPGFFKSNLHNSFTLAPESIRDYDKSRTNALQTFDNSIENAPDPIAVAKTVNRIIYSKKPKMSYRVGKDGFWLPLLQFFNFNLFEMGTRRKFNLP